ncbi:RNA-directed DNA polymerase [Gossypium australe]|uniref:RNA-directed DNA polymerase n=1 Tax=Gossypium australe TaxID=47621 RepID=A0A5B6WM09_9ROSI|nr:RNA-directed DNA polymerase [Gossypium australe]
MVSIEEIKGEIWDCNESKASRPDGYDFNFFRHSWAIIKEDLLHFVRDFIISSRIDKAVNSTMLGGVIDFLVSDTQTTFIRGRQILNGFLLANEVVDSMKKKRCNDGGFVLKMAYDSL